jgi:nucleoside-diphosphate-sugar epimerase
LVERLLRDGASVIGVDNLCTGRLENLAGAFASPAFRFAEADVCSEIPVPEPVDLVLHFASPASPMDYARLACETLAVNSTGTGRACDLALRNRAPLVFASTSEVYGEPLVHPQPESYFGNVNPVGPRACYDEGKRFAEALIATRARTDGLDGRIVRIFNTYGPRMRAGDGRVIPAFVGAALRGEPLTIFGAGTQTRSFCFVDDLVEGIVRFARLAPAPEMVVNPGNPVETSVRELAELVRELAGVPLQVASAPRPADEPTRRRTDISRARHVLGWEPQVGLRAGLATTLAAERG